jgi:hypothetical protein
MIQAHEKGVSGTYRFVYVSNDCTTNDEERSALKSSQDPEDKERRQIRSQGRAN